MFLPNFFSVLTTLTFLQPTHATIQHYSLLSPDLPPPRKPSNSNALQAALTSIQTAISSAISTGNTTYGLLDTTSTSFSIDIFFQHEPESLFTYHYNAPGLINSTDGVKEIDSDSFYRIGSISKLLTVYIFLITVGDASFNEPITKFIPELAQYAAQTSTPNNEIDITAWSHLGGIPLGTASDARADPAVAVYLPPGVPLPNIISPIPSNIPDNDCPNVAVSPCTWQAFFESITLSHPGLAPFHGPSYSNIAFSLLSPVQTHRWMKPSTFTANDDMLVGGPWEIFKAPPSSSPSPKSSWMYTKAGHIGLYYSNFVLLPDCYFGFSALVVGDDAVPANTVVSDIIAAIAVPAFEAAAKEEATLTYAGVYTSSV
ncbi:hypothetical protein BDZ45DRAFT_670938 [Acephala macrosclerotiorum]|nr:hypothetical protein BDZ45DRAFT_670938 [Acephala macrosclerotiorum]